jgi:hypothetical protein
VRGPASKEIAATTRAEFKRHRDRLREHVRQLDGLIGGCADMVGLDAATLQAERAKLQESADRITVQLRSRSWFYFGVLQAAALAGTDLGYTLPEEGKPYGPGIEWLMATAAQHGHLIGPDRACALIKQFNALPWARAKFIGEGNMSVDADVVHSPLWFWMWL